MRPRRASAPGTRLEAGPWWLGLLVILGVSVPCLVVEEDWHGRAMIDLGSALWVPFAVAVAMAFLAGGAIAATARGSRRKTAHLVAFGRGSSCGAAAIVLLVACDLVRRFGIAHVGLSAGVLELWLDAGLGAVALSGLAASLANVRARRRRPRLVRAS